MRSWTSICGEEESLMAKVEILALGLKAEPGDEGRRARNGVSGIVKCEFLADTRSGRG